MGLSHAILSALAMVSGLGTSPIGAQGGRPIPVASPFVSTVTSFTNVTTVKPATTFAFVPCNPNDPKGWPCGYAKAAIVIGGKPANSKDLLAAWKLNPNLKVKITFTQGPVVNNLTSMNASKIEVLP